MERHDNDQLSDPIDLKKVLEKDEQETRYDRVIKHRKKLKIRRRRIRILGIIFIVGFIAIYLISPMSDVKVLKVNNNVVYSQQEILKKVSLNYNEKLVFHPTFAIESKLKEDELIKDVSVKKNYFNGTIYIDVEEEKVIGHYEKDGKPYVLLANGKNVELDETRVELIGSPYIRDLDEDQRKLLAKKMKDIDSDDIALVSEIRNYTTSYDVMLELLMQDGHIVRTDYDSIYLLKNYRQVLKEIKSSYRCIEFIELTNTIQTIKCE